MSVVEHARSCENCGAELREGQDWCLQCGVAAPGSLEGGGPGWRSATTVLAIAAALVLGAAAAAYAALTQPGPRKLPPRVVTVAQAPAPTVTTPTTPGLPSTPVTPGTPGTPTTLKPLPNTGAPPKIPLSPSTPSGTPGGEAAPGLPEGGGSGSGAGGSGSSGSGNSGSSGSGGSGSGGGSGKGGSGASGGTPEPPAPILLDTNAASTYNPYGYPPSWFGDPSLAIDGETSTGWTAQVNPAVAPKMAEGLAIDLKSAQKLGSLALISSTPGMTVQVYGGGGATLPASITDPAWSALSPSLDAKKRKTLITLRHPHKTFRFIVLWISGAPPSAVGTAAAPGHVRVNELELFAAGK